MKVLEQIRSSYTGLVSRISDRNWLIIRALIFPLVILTPFFLTHTGQPVCIPLHYIGDGMYQQGAALSKTSPLYGILSLIIALGFSVAAVQMRSPRSHKEKIRFVRKQIIVSVLAILLTIPLYLVMWSHSLAVKNNAWGYDSNCHFIGHWEDALFGYGLPIAVVIIIAIFYLLFPLISYYRLFLSKRHIGQIKKKELFQ